MHRSPASTFSLSSQPQNCHPTSLHLVAQSLSTQRVGSKLAIFPLRAESWYDFRPNKPTPSLQGVSGPPDSGSFFPCKRLSTCGLSSFATHLIRHHLHPRGQRSLLAP